VSRCGNASSRRVSEMPPLLVVVRPSSLTRHIHFLNHRRGFLTLAELQSLPENMVVIGLGSDIFGGSRKRLL
jgi:hypothetical protein